MNENKTYHYECTEEPNTFQIFETSSYELVATVYSHAEATKIVGLLEPEQDSTQYLLDQVARLTAENTVLKEKWSTPKREPLSDGEIYDLDDEVNGYVDKNVVRAVMRWIRNVEIAHGIGVDDE